MIYERPVINQGSAAGNGEMDSCDSPYTTPSSLVLSMLSIPKTVKWKERKPCTAIYIPDIPDNYPQAQGSTANWGSQLAQKSVSIQALNPSP